MISKLKEQLYLPLRAAWAAKHGISQKEQSRLTHDLLMEIDDLPQLGDKTAIILGSTRATAFAVTAALRAGHTDFVIIGGKKIGAEHPGFTKYADDHMSIKQSKIARNGELTEAQFARDLLVAEGISPKNIHIIKGDTSTNTGANMRVLANSAFAAKKTFEFYTLSGFARRAFMTARKVLGDKPVIAVHNAYPLGVYPNSWAFDNMACAFMVGEGVKTLGKSPLYVKRGYAVKVDLSAEAMRIRQHRTVAAQALKPKA